MPSAYFFEGSRGSFLKDTENARRMNTSGGKPMITTTLALLLKRKIKIKNAMSKGYESERWMEIASGKPEKLWPLSI